MPRGGGGGEKSYSKKSIKKMNFWMRKLDSFFFSVFVVLSEFFLYSRVPNISLQSFD